MRFGATCSRNLMCNKVRVKLALVSFYFGHSRNPPLQDIMKIKAYEFIPAGVHASFDPETGGFNPETKKMVPMSINDGELSGAEIFDNITLAAEAGLLDTDKWVKQLFADLEDFEYFLNELSQYNDSYTIFDRWWHAFSQLACGKDTPGFSTSKEIADGLYKHASETGQI